MNLVPKQLNIWLPLLFSGVMVVGILAGMKLQQAKPTFVLNPESGQENEELAGSYQNISDILHYVEAKYVDEIDKKNLSEEAIHYILSHLDPHSEFISAAELESVNEDLEGNFEGIGIDYAFLRDTLTIISPMANSPAFYAGLLSGDQVVSIQDSALYTNPKMGRDLIIQRLKQKTSDKVKLGIRRNSSPTALSIEVEKGLIASQSVEIAMMLDSKTGLLKLNRFCATSYQEFMQNLEVLVEKQGLKNLVIDLRDNAGGYLQESINILSQLFKEKDKLLLYTVGKNGQKNEYFTTGKNFYNIEKIAVLIDENSASSSEILAAALQDWDRATVIGRRSFGKGLVQEQYDLSDGSALRLTVARYYTPSGRCIQRPYDGKNSETYENELYKRRTTGELSSNVLLKKEAKQTFKTASGRIVYGGGGVSPDFFIPIKDTFLLSEKFGCLRQHLPSFVLSMRQTNRTVANNLDDFLQNYQVKKVEIDNFFLFAEQEGCQLSANEKGRLQAAIEELIKAETARQFFGNIGFFAVTNKSDLCIEKALQILSQK